MSREDPQKPNAEFFKNVCAGIQSIAVVVAVLGGGIWGAYVFNAELRVENAQARLQAIQREIDVSSILSTNMDVKQINHVDSQFIEVWVTIKNNGGKDSAVLFKDQPPLTVQRVQFSDSGKPTFTKVAEQGQYDLDGELTDGWSVPAGDASIIRFLVPIPGDGVYSVSFYANEMETPARLLDNGEQVHSEIVSDTQFIVVESGGDPGSANEAVNRSTQSRGN